MRVPRRYGIKLRYVRFPKKKAVAADSLYRIPFRENFFNWNLICQKKIV